MLTPNIYEALPFFKVVEEKFYYSLTSDDETYTNWATAVQNPTIYESSGNLIVKSRKFSSFILIWQCTTEEEHDGCCMISENDGTLCLLRGDEATELFTFRYTQSEWTKVMETFRTKQEDYIPEWGDAYIGGRNNAIEYLDTFVCAVDENHEEESTCYIYQSDWAEGITPRYPRFGTRDWGI